MVNSVLTPLLFFPPSPNDTIIQNMETSNWKLDNSVVYGAKAGYFFNKFGYSWLGLEVEGFTTKPNIKQQTVDATQSILYIPAAGQPRNPDGSCGPSPINCPTSVTSKTQQPVPAASMRVTTAAANVIVRYPGKVFQPYAGIGLGMFWFDVSAPLTSSDLRVGLNLLGGVKFMITENLALFGEYKYNRASPRLNDPIFQIEADYSISHFVGGLAFHF
jgi:opacity protein-like surface antigen